MRQDCSEVMLDGLSVFSAHKAAYPNGERDFKRQYKRNDQVGPIDAEHFEGERTGHAWQERKDDKKHK